MPQAGASTGMPALMEACRAGFWPAPAARICPRITSDTSPASTRARSSTALIATLPSSCAGRLASAPLKEPTGVRAALAITMVDWSLFIVNSAEGFGLAGRGLCRKAQRGAVWFSVIKDIAGALRTCNADLDMEARG